MDAKERAAELYDAWDNRTITREEIAAALADARAAGYAEAIEQAVNLVQVPRHIGRTSRHLAAAIRALAPADKEQQ